MQSQTARSLLIMADASPKGKLDVWSPVLFCGRAAACMPLQRMSDLLASTASVETKLEEAQRAADSFAELTSAAQAVGQKKKLLFGRKEKTSCECHVLFSSESSPRPKAISTIRQKKLAAREQLQALLHTLNMLDLELKLPEHGLHAADTANGEVRITSPDGCFLWNANTGQAVWDKIMEADLKDLRVVLSPDEGSSMFCCFAFLAANGFRVGWCRDELQLGLFSGFATSQCCIFLCDSFISSHRSRHKLSNHFLRLLRCNAAVSRFSAHVQANYSCICRLF
ncbi:unnamed protein product [Symbiodinium sp. CCMP2456]|nr:unnamed protein product [Symbiodinium sp. CCMP2456]